MSKTPSQDTTFLWEDSISAWNAKSKAESASKVADNIEGHEPNGKTHTHTHTQRKNSCGPAEMFEGCFGGDLDSISELQYLQMMRQYLRSP